MGAMEKDKSVIPKGYYCYRTINGKQILCPYWARLAKEPSQENGYCFFLEKSDWDINEEEGMIPGWYGDGTPLPLISAHEINWSLLWDKCKMCDVNIKEEKNSNESDTRDSKEIQ